MCFLYLPNGKSLSSLLERGILISLIKCLDPGSIFEFGTYLGETTLLLAANSSARIFTLDFDNNETPEANKGLDEHERKNLNTRIQEGAKFKGTKYEERIETLTGDSTKYDLSPYYSKIDFVLIDGGHNIDVVENDTKHAFSMLTKDKPGCIIWHDYNNPYYQITEFLDHLSIHKPLYHVEETKYVFYLSNITENYFAK